MSARIVCLGLTLGMLPLIASNARAEQPVEVLRVMAAGSLREALNAMVERFRADHPQTKVVVNSAGSQELRAQIEHGAPADVFASADLRQMEALRKAGLVSEARIFARNEPVIIVPKGNPARIQSLMDLPKARRLVVGASEVPIGKYTDDILANASRAGTATFGEDVRRRIVSRELNVRHVLSKVLLGEADAGIVYRTDAMTTDKVEVVTIPGNVNVVAEYPIAMVARSKNAKAAQAWIALVLSPAGQAILKAAGFMSGSAPTANR